MLNRDGAMSEQQAGKLFAQVVLAIKYLHDQKISHRDIKTENILLDVEGRAKLIDFGLSKNFEPQKDGEPTMMKTFCGSPSYTPPEIVNKVEYDAELADVWCLGVTLYAMLAA